MAAKRKKLIEDDGELSGNNSKKKKLVLNDTKIVKQQTAPKIDITTVSCKPYKREDHLEIVKSSAFEVKANSDATKARKKFSKPPQKNDQTEENISVVKNVTLKMCPNNTEKSVTEKQNLPESSQKNFHKRKNKRERKLRKEKLNNKRPSDGQPKTTTDITFKCDGQPKTTTDTSVKRDGQPKTSTDTTVKSHGQPKTTKDIPVKRDGQPKTSTDTTVKRDGQPKTTTDITVKSHGQPKTTKDIPVKSDKRQQITPVTPRPKQPKIATSHTQPGESQPQIATAKIRPTDNQPQSKIFKPADFSNNWKMLQEVLSKPTLRPTRKFKKIKQKNETEKICESSKEVTDKSPAIWFDDVDDILIESLKKAESKPIEAHGTSGTDQSDDRLVKAGSFIGLTKVVAIDCEMVGVGERGSNSILARVSIVNHFGRCIYDKYVKPREPVTDYRTAVSGIRPQDLINGEDFMVVQQEVSEIFKNRLLVGHALENDLKVLFLDHPRKMIRDTSQYKEFRKLFSGRKPSLKKLSETVLRVKVQEGEHNSVQDAQAAMRLYTMYRKRWENEVKSKHKSNFKSSKKKKTKASS